MAPSLPTASEASPTIHLTPQIELGLSASWVTLIETVICAGFLVTAATTAIFFGCVLEPIMLAFMAAGVYILAPYFVQQLVTGQSPSGERLGNDGVGCFLLGMPMVLAIFLNLIAHVARLEISAIPNRLQ